MILVPVRLVCGCYGEEHPDRTATVKMYVLESCPSHAAYKGKFLFVTESDVIWRDEAMAKLAEDWLTRWSTSG